MLGFLILLFVMIGVWVLLLGVADTSEVSKNWPKYRCNPSVMPFASFYGHDTTENLNFCLTGMLNSEMTGALSPVFKILATFLGTITTLVAVANSIRLEMATFMGGINTIFQNFTDRFVQVSSNIRTSTQRMKMLMGRIYGTFFAMIFMSMSAMTALTNFGDTFLFKFLDTFCFDPDTTVNVVGKGSIPVKEVRTGDIFTNGSKVTATFSFLADGQPMVELCRGCEKGIKVSTNHYVRYQDTWVRADEHPEAIPIGSWNGGSERPLICFNTNDHRIPVANYTFLDYDETSEADDATMKWVEGVLNGRQRKQTRGYEYSTLVSPSTCLKTKSGNPILPSSVALGTELSMGKVIAIIKKKSNRYCELPSGDCVTPGLLLWDPYTNSWFRAGDRYRSMIDPVDRDYYSFIVSSTACFELYTGQVVRDYFEVHSPDTEQFYAKAIHDASCVLAE
jgi:hypothetical protein